MAAEASNGQWSCSKCTFINEADDAVCGVCAEGARPILRKGKGTLRSKPPLIPRLSETSKKQDEFKSSTNTRGRSPRKKPNPAAAMVEEEEEKCDEDVGEEADEEKEEFLITRSYSSRPARTRSSSRRVEQQHQQQQEKQIPPLVIDDSDDQSDWIGGGGGGSARATRSSATDDNECDNDDNDDDDDDDDDDDAGETPLLLGRGWSANQRDRAKRRKHDRDRDQDKATAVAASKGSGSRTSGKARGNGSGGSAAGRRGKKRQRPLPACPRGDLFRDRRYPVEDGDDDSDLPPPTLSLALPGGDGQPFWRWPPRPSVSAAAAAMWSDDGGGAMSPGSRGGTRGQGGGDRPTNDGGVDPPVVVVGRSSFDCGGGGGGSGGDRGGKYRAAVDTKQFPAAGSLTSVTQELKPKKRRYRLSLPAMNRVRNDLGGGNSATGGPATVAPAVAASCKPKEATRLAAEAQQTAAAPSGEARFADPATGEVDSRRVSVGAEGGIGTSDAAAAEALPSGTGARENEEKVGSGSPGEGIAAGARSAAATARAAEFDADQSSADGRQGPTEEIEDDGDGNGDTDIEEESSTNTLVGRAGGGDRAEAEIEERNAEVEHGAPQPPPPSALPGPGDSEEEVEEDDGDEAEDTISLAEGEGERWGVEVAEIQEDGSVAPRPRQPSGVNHPGGTRAAATAAGGPVRCSMTMDVGGSDSDISDEGGARDGKGTGAVHLGSAFDEAVNHPPTSASAPAVTTAVTTAASLAASVGPNDARGAQVVSSLPAQAPQTPSPQQRGRRGEEGQQAALSGPEPSPAAMGLIDTPPPKRTRGKSAVGAASATPEVRTEHKSTPRCSRELEMLTRDSAGPKLHDSQASPAPLPSSIGSGTRERWACGHCTLLNRARSRKCTACGMPKAPSQARTRAAVRGSPVSGGSDERNVDRFSVGGGPGGSGSRSGSDRVGGGCAGGGASDEDGRDGLSPGHADEEKSGSIVVKAGSGGGSGDYDDGEPPTRASGKRPRPASEGDGSEGATSLSPAGRVTRSGGTAKAWACAGRACGRESAGDNGGKGGQRGRDGDFDATAAAAADVSGGSAVGTAVGKRGGGSFDAFVQGFVGDVDALPSGIEDDDWEGEEEQDEEVEEGGRGEDSDEDYCEEDGDDFEHAEMIGSQIEEMFLRRLQGGGSQPATSPPLSQRSVQSVDSASPSPERKRRPRPLAAGQVLDLTDAVDDERLDKEGTAGWGGGGGSCGRGVAGALEDIDDDDDDDDFDIPGLRGGVAGAEAAATEEPPKFRFFSSVRQHRDRGSSCVDFSAMEAAPAGGGAAAAKTYLARKTARDRKAKPKKGGGKTKKLRAAPRTKTSAAAGRGRAKGGGGDGRASARGGRARAGNASRSGGVPSSWIPPGVSVASSSAAAAAAGLSRGSRGGGGVTGRRGYQPLNHYRGNDEMVDDSFGGGGFHWESVGQSSFGGGL